MSYNESFGDMQRRFKDEEWNAQCAQGREEMKRKDAEHLARMNRSGQRGGAVGSKPTLCTRFLLRLADLNPELRNRDVFDFGAGKKAQQTAILRDAGFSSVTPYDIGANDHGTELSDAIGHQIVLMSNVLNVQDSTGSQRKLLRELRNNVEFGTTLVCNLPQEPRYGKLTVRSTEDALEGEGWAIVRKTGTHRAPVWVCVAR